MGTVHKKFIFLHNQEAVLIEILNEEETMLY